MILDRLPSSAPSSPAPQPQAGASPSSVPAAKALTVVQSSLPSAVGASAVSVLPPVVNFQWVEKAHHGNRIFVPRFQCPLCYHWFSLNHPLDHFKREHHLRVTSTLEIPGQFHDAVTAARKRLALPTATYSLPSHPAHAAAAPAGSDRDCGDRGCLALPLSRRDTESMLSTCLSQTNASASFHGTSQSPSPSLLPSSSRLEPDSLTDAAARNGYRLDTLPPVLRMDRPANPHPLSLIHAAATEALASSANALHSASSHTLDRDDSHKTIVALKNGLDHVTSSLRDDHPARRLKLSQNCDYDGELGEAPRSWAPESDDVAAQLLLLADAKPLTGAAVPLSAALEETLTPSSFLSEDDPQTPVVAADAALRRPPSRGARGSLVDPQRSEQLVLGCMRRRSNDVHQKKAGPTACSAVRQLRQPHSTRRPPKTAAEDTLCSNCTCRESPMRSSTTLGPRKGVSPLRSGPETCDSLGSSHRCLAFSSQALLEKRVGLQKEARCAPTTAGPSVKRRRGNAPSDSSACLPSGGSHRRLQHCHASPRNVSISSSRRTDCSQEEEEFGDAALHTVGCTETASTLIEAVPSKEDTTLQDVLLEALRATGFSGFPELIHARKQRLQADMRELKQTAQFFFKRQGSLGEELDRLASCIEACETHERALNQEAKAVARLTVKLKGLRSHVAVQLSDVYQLMSLLESSFLTCERNWDVVDSGIPELDRVLPTKHGPEARVEAHSPSGALLDPAAPDAAVDEPCPAAITCKEDSEDRASTPPRTPDLAHGQPAQPRPAATQPTAADGPKRGHLAIPALTDSVKTDASPLGETKVTFAAASTASTTPIHTCSTEDSSPLPRGRSAEPAGLDAAASMPETDANMVPAEASPHATQGPLTAASDASTAVRGDALSQDPTWRRPPPAAPASATYDQDA